MKINVIPFFFGLVCILALSACNSEPAQPTLDPTQGAQMLAGKFTTTITAEEIGNFQISRDPALAMNQGDWIFTLTKDGKFSAEMGGNFMATGQYTVKGDEIAVYIESSCEECGCLNAIGRYIWALNGNELSFAKVAGSCYGMDLVLTSRPLVRQP